MMSKSQSAAPTLFDAHFQVSATEDAFVNYSIDVGTTATLVGGQTGKVDFLIERLRAERRRRQHHAEELRGCKVEILDALHALSEDPLGDATEARSLLGGLFERLETETNGEEESGS